MVPRKRPVHGVNIQVNAPTIVFVTVCTDERRPWLASAENHDHLRQTWQDAQAWLVGRYVLMPDHLHLFAAPGRLGISLENWIKYWKSQFTNKQFISDQKWQANHWDRRMRSGESYDQKWEYVRNNPVRAGLVTKPEDWPYQGELNRLEWW
jgi:putative transposase